MTSSNDTITISTINGSSLPAFNAEALTTYLGGGGSATGSWGMSSSISAGDTITFPYSTVGNYTSSAYNGTAVTGQMYYDSTSNNHMVYTGTGGWQTITNQYYGEDFKDRFPEWNAFRKLCNDYPGLEKAYDNLKLVYTVCYADSLLPKEDEE